MPSPADPAPPDPGSQHGPAGGENPVSRRDDAGGRSAAGSGTASEAGAATGSGAGAATGRPGGGSAGSAAASSDRSSRADALAEDESSSLRGPLLRFGVLVVLLAAGFAVLRWSPLAEYLDQDALLTTFRDLAANPWAPVVLIGIYAALCPLGLPVSPLVLVGGLVFGFAWGALWNFLGTWLGAATSFGVARLLGRDLVERLAGGRLERVEHLVERHGFWALVRLRFVPIPYALVNYAAAFAGVRPGVFLTATAVGLAPAIALYTWFAAALFGAATGDRLEVMLQLAAALLGVFLLTFLPRFFRGAE